MKTRRDFLIGKTNANEWCETDFVLSGKPKARNGRNGSIADVEMHPEKITAQRLLNLLRLQDFRCALTGIPLSPDTAALDHIVPISRGGKHAMENVQVILANVNQAKGTMSQDEFLEMCRAVIDFNS
jgi:5-methylcytosine-specific restriction endonuclease McrA